MNTQTRYQGFQNAGVRQASTTFDSTSAGKPRFGRVKVLGPGGFFNLAYTEWGPPRAERTVLCAHGVSRLGRDFDHLAMGLAAAGARVVAPDLPGRGRSDWLGSWAHYSDATYTAAMAALIARLDVESIDWVGTSAGGHIGMMVAAEAGTPIRRLILNDFGARLAASALRPIAGYLGRDWRFESFEELEAHVRDAHAPFGTLTDDQWRHIAEHSAVRDDRGGLRFHYDPAIGRRFMVPILVDIVLWRLWERVECPVLVIRGQHSTVLSVATVAEMLKRGTAAREGQVFAVEVPGCGHAPALMDDDQIAMVREFTFADEPRLEVPASWPTIRSTAQTKPLR